MWREGFSIIRFKIGNLYKLLFLHIIMTKCIQCGNNFVRSWGQMFGNAEKFTSCQNCLRMNEQVKRKARLQEEGRIQAQQKARIDEHNRQQMNKNLKNIRRNFFGLR